MKNNNTYQLIFASLLVLCGCREPFDFENQNSESLLVVETTITNEMKRQVINLTRTYELKANEAELENNAIVYIQDSQDNTFIFTQDENGAYISDISFQAIPNVSYTLFITTQGGKSYTSLETNLPPISEISNIYAELITRDDGLEGAQVFIDSNNDAGGAQFFKYDYEETYKLIAPNWHPYEAILFNHYIIPENGITVFEAEFVERSEQERICFSSNKSFEIIQASTNQLTNNNVLRFPVHFIDNLSLIRDRYSILVKQYVQSPEAYTFYRITNELGNNENILSEDQPGFVPGNMISLNDTEEKVIGFFEVASVSEKRIYFNYTDLNLPIPSYLYECEVLDLDYNKASACGQCMPPTRDERSEIYRLLTSFEEFNYNYSIVEVPPIIATNWRITNPECGDCSSVSSNIVPDFWED